MAAVATAGAGNWSSTTPGLPWTGGTVPATTDTITINHAVVIDQNVTAGSDPGFAGTAAIAIGATGTLSFDTTASRTVTLLGDVTIASGGQLLIGTSGARVPVANTITINFNAGATTGRYGLRVTYSTTSVFKCYGATRKTNTTLSAQANSGQKVLVVTDATGWQAGDVIEIGSTAGGAGTTGQHEEFAIAAAGVSGNTITLTTNLANTHAAGAHITNTTKNIVFTTSAATVRWFADTRFGTLANHVLDNVTMNYLGGMATASNGQVGYCIQGSAAGEVSVGSFTDVVCYRVASNGNGLNFFGNIGGRNSTVTNCAFVATTGGQGSGIGLQNSAFNITVTGCNFYRVATGIIANFSAGALGCSVSNCVFMHCSGAISISAGGNIITASNSYQGCLAAILTNSLAVDIIDTGSLSGTVIKNTVDFSVTSSLYGTYQFTNSNFQITSFISSASQAFLLSGAAITLLNCTQDATSNVFKKYMTNGVFVKNLTTQKNSVSSVELDTLTTGDNPYSFTFLAKTGVAYVITGNMQYNSTYDDAAYSFPTVTVSGLGITPVVATATSAALSAWEPFTINVTQSSGSDGLLTVTLNGNSATATGKVYFDGIVVPPFITAARFYGYKFDETTPTRTVNAYVSASEATALAYTGIAIDWTAKTLVITTAHTMQEIYDYCQAQMSAAANLTKSEFLTTTDGLNYTLLPDWDFTVTNVAVTATGQHLYMSATGAWSVTGASGDFTGILTDATQTRVKINTTGIVAGSRIQLYDVTAAAELANEIVAGTSHSIAFTHTTDHSIRLRLTYTSGSATCYDWYTSTNTVTNTGLSFAVAQVSNAIYINNGIDGSTVTEASVSGTTIRIYIDDPDNTTTGQRIYNWYYYYLFTAAGIREQDGDYVTASDSTHITLANTMKIINQDTVNPLNLTGANITPVSGAATNIFDLTNAASICLNFNRVEGLSLNTTLTEVKSIVGDNQALIIAM